MIENIGAPQGVRRRRRLRECLATGTRRPTPNPTVQTNPLDTELVLYDTAGCQAHVLNHTAAYIWTLCNGSRTLAAVARGMANIYGIPYRQALLDVRKLTTKLENAGLLYLR